MRNALLAIACLLALPGQAAAAATSPVVPGWDAGHHDTLTFRHRVVARSADKLVRDDDFRGRIQVKVDAKSPHGYYISWQYRDFGGNGRSYADLDLELVMSPDGAELELVNVADVQRQIRSQLANADGGDAAPGYEGALARHDLESFARDAKLVEAFYLKDVQMYFMPLGIEVAATGVAEIDEPVAAFGPWGAMHGSERWTLQRLDAQPAVTTFEWAQAIVPAAVAATAREALAKDFPFVQRADGISTKGTFVLGAKNRWPLGVAILRDSNRGALRQVESWELRSQRFGDLMDAKRGSGEGSPVSEDGSNEDARERLAASIEAAMLEPPAGDNADMSEYLAEWTKRVAQAPAGKQLDPCGKDAPDEIVATIRVRADGSLDGIDVRESPCRAATDTFVRSALRAAPFARPPLQRGVEVLHATRRWRVGPDAIVISEAL